MKAHVINLEKYIENFNIQKVQLEKIGLSVERFNAINAFEDEHLKYLSKIDSVSLEIVTKSILGCSLSHIVLCEKLLLENQDYFLILEDDAFPLFDKESFNLKLNETISNINIIDKNWDIILLHSDGPFPNYNSYFTHPLCGSTAAYIISKSGAKKISKTKARWHIDLQTSNDSNLRKYRSKENLFWTNEKSSTNRVNNNDVISNLKNKLLTSLIPLRGEKTWKDILNFNIIKIPFFEKSLNGNDISNILIMIFLLNFLLAKKKKIYN